MAHVLVIQTVVEVIAKELTLRDSAAHPSALAKAGVVGNELAIGSPDDATVTITAH